MFTLYTARKQNKHSLYVGTRRDACRIIFVRLCSPKIITLCFIYQAALTIAIHHCRQHVDCPSTHSYLSMMVLIPGDEPLFIFQQPIYSADCIMRLPRENTIAMTTMTDIWTVMMTVIIIIMTINFVMMKRISTVVT